MDIYTEAKSTTFVKGFSNHFMMPTDSGGIPAVAVSRRSAGIIVSAYTILIGLIFSVAWKLILAIIMGFWPTLGNPNRYIALVALWNSGTTMNAMLLMFEYCRRMISYGAWSKPGENPTTGAPESDDKPPAKSQYSNLRWGFFFLFIAFVMWGGKIAAGVLLGGELLMGNVAPANKDSIFYPDVAKYSLRGDNGDALSKLFSLKAPAALRAIGSVEASDDVTVRKRLSITKLEPPSKGPEDKPWMGMTYDYNVTGVDMGLQTEPKLRLMVKGSCHTDYTWLNGSTEKEDSYRLFGGDKFHKTKFQQGVDIPPMVEFEIGDTPPGSDNISFAMFVNAGGLYSYTSGQDAWYFTEPTGEASIPHVVRRERPALSCWETRRWYLNGKDVETSKLDTLPGLNLHSFWINVFKFEFAVPRIVSLGKAAGPGALKSATFASAPYFVLNAGASDTKRDLDRLVLASWVSSRNVLRDTTTYVKGDLSGMDAGTKGGVEASAAKIVIETAEVGTLSVRILISVPAVLLFLLAVQGIFDCILKYGSLGKPSMLRKYLNRGISLQATQLYRYLDEELYGQARWAYRLGHIPALARPPNYGIKPLKTSEEEKYLPGSARREFNERYQPTTGKKERAIEREEGKGTAEIIAEPIETEEGTTESRKNPSRLRDCAEPRPILLRNDPEEKTKKGKEDQKGELTISMLEDPKEDFQNMKRDHFKNIEM